MSSYRYPVTLTPAEEGGFVVEFPGMPFGATQGDTLEEALEAAEDALVVIVTSLIHDGQDVPAPKGRSKYWIDLPEDVALKLAFYRAFRASGVSRAELGRRLGWHGPQVRRLFDAGHSTRVGDLFRAFRAIGKRVGFVVEDAA